MAYNAEINLNIVGATRLNAVIASVGKLNNLAQNLKPLNLLSPGAGNLGNKLRQALKPITDFARDIENGNKRISNTFEGASQQASTFRTVLNNVKVAAGGYDKQVASVKLYANALAEAEKQAAKLSRAQLDLVRTAKGLQTQNIRDAEVIGRRARVSQGRAAQARTREAASNAIIGGAFPLLFGQGAGAALGGGLGGAAGGLAGGQFGFGLSLVGTAVGTAFDQFTQAAIESGKALLDPIANFQKLAEVGLIASRSQKQYIERLIEAGRVTEAAAAIQDELIKKIGVEGVRDLQNAGAASDKLNKAFAEFSLQAQAAIAGPLSGLLSWLADVVAVGNQVNREAASQTDIMQGLSAPDRRALQREEQRILQGANLFNEAQKRQQVAQLYQSYAGRAQIQRPDMALDTTPELQARGQTQELAAQVQLEAQKLSLIGMSAEKDAQAYAVVAKRIAQQEYENKLLEIKNSWIGKAFDAERNLLLIRQANLQFAGKLKTIEVELSRANEKAAEDAERQYITVLQAEAAMYKQAEQNLLFRVKLGQYIDGEVGGAKALLDNYGNIYDQRLATFNVEKEIALIEAARNGTIEEVTRLFKYRLDLLNAEAGLEQAIAKLTEDRYALEKQINLERARTDAAQPFVNFRREQEAQRNATQSYLRLVMEGVLPAEAERIVNFERLVTEQLQYNADQIKAVEAQIVLTEATITEAQARGAAVEKLKEQLNVLKQQQEIIKGQAAQGAGAGLSNRERLQEEIASVQGQLNTLLDPINQITTAAEGIGLAFSDSFKGIVSGTMTAQEALANFFQSVADQFLDMAAQMIAKWIQLTILNSILKLFPTGAATGAAASGGYALPGGAGYAEGFSLPSLLPGRANGGPVTGGMPYMVGERGPELFVPGRSGSIVPNNELGGGDNVNVVVNVDAKGTNVEGNAPDARRLGTVISAAVQAELIKQKRPGGLLAV